MNSFYKLENEGGAAAPRPDKMRVVTRDGEWRGEWYQTDTAARMKRFANSLRSLAREIGDEYELNTLAKGIENGDYVDRW